MSYVARKSKPRASSTRRPAVTSAAKKSVRRVTGGSSASAKRSSAAAGAVRAKPKPKVKSSMTSAQAEAIWMSLTPKQRDFVFGMALKQNPALAGLSGGNFFKSIGKFLKKAAPAVIKVAAPIAIGAATRALEKRLSGGALRLAGRGSGYGSMYV